MPALLTIAVPTYNRADLLQASLDRLAMELVGLEDVVDVFISDNASTDGTADVVARFAQGRRNVRAVRNEQNVGADGNIGNCYLAADSGFLWILGDDDLPRIGTLRALTDVLQRERPSILYLESKWMTSTAAGVQALPDGPPSHVTLSREAFGRRVHVWLTFISGVVVRLDDVPAERRQTLARRHMNTSLVQLGWVLDALDRGERFVHVTDPCLLATAGNTGGYAVLKTFGANFKSIVQSSLAARPVLARAMLRRHLLCYMPGLVWGLRSGSVGTFTDEKGWQVLRAALGGHASFWLLIAPIMRGNRILAWGAMQVGRVVGRLVKQIDRLRSRPLAAGPAR